MFEINNNMISITKGDTAVINVNLKLNTGELYEMQNGDVLTFTVKANPSAPIMLQVHSTTNEIPILSEESALLKVGKCCFDIQLNTANNEVYTVVGLKDNNSYNMTVWEEVTCN